MDGRPVVAEGQERKADTRIVLALDARLHGDAVGPPALVDRGAVGDLVDEMELTVSQLLHHGVVVRDLEADLLNGRLDQPDLVAVGVLFRVAFLVQDLDIGHGTGIVRAGQVVVHPRALELFVDLIMPVAGLGIPGDHLVGAGDHGGMGIVSGLRIQDRLFQELSCVHGIGEVLFKRDVLAVIADIDAASIVIDLAAGSDHADRVRHGHQQAQFEEVRQEFMVQRDLDLPVGNDVHAAQGERVRVVSLAEIQLLALHDLLPGIDVVIVTQQVLRPVDLAADLFHFGAHHQQDGERVIPCRDGRAVGIIQVVRQHHGISLVAEIVPARVVIDHDAGVHHVHALVLVPVDQVIAVDQRTHVDIGGVVAEELSEEVALGDRGMPDDQFFREFDLFLGGFRFRSRFFLRQSQQGRLGQEQQGKQQAQEFLQFVHVDQILPSYSIRFILSFFSAPAAPARLLHQSKQSPTWLIMISTPSGVL